MLSNARFVLGNSITPEVPLVGRQSIAAECFPHVTGVDHPGCPDCVCGWQPVRSATPMSQPVSADCRPLLPPSRFAQHQWQVDREWGISQDDQAIISISHVSIAPVTAPLKVRVKRTKRVNPLKIFTFIGILLANGRRARCCAVVEIYPIQSQSDGLCRILLGYPMMHD